VLIKILTDVEYEKAIQKMLNTTFDKAYIRLRAEQIYALSAGVEKYTQVYKQVLLGVRHFS
jgi:hypothetical protein